MNSKSKEEQKVGKVLEKEELEKLVERLISLPENEVKIEDLVKADIAGIPVAHYMVKKGYVFTKKEFLKVKSYPYGRTVAHVMVAVLNWEFEDEEILSLADIFDWTVAHEMAWNGLNRYLLDKPDILKLRDKTYGLSVEELIIEKFLEKNGFPAGSVRTLSPEEKEKIKHTIFLVEELGSVQKNVTKDLGKKKIKI